MAINLLMATNPLMAIDRPALAINRPPHPIDRPAHPIDRFPEIYTSISKTSLSYSPTRTPVSSPP
jgi:hypothetical protein